MLRDRPTRFAGIALTLAAALLAGPTPGAAAGGTAAPAPATAADLVPARGVLFGAGLPTTGTSQGTETALSGQEAMLGRKLDLHRVFRLWDNPEPDAVLRTDIQRGRTPVLSIKPRYSDGRQVSWAAIARGEADPMIVKHADGLRSLGAPLLLTFHHEPDLSSNASYGTAAEFVAAWRHYQRVFTARGATNVAFAWIVTTSTFGRPGVTDTFYPGDDAVDWLALDAYNWFGCSAGQPAAWRPLANVTRPFAAWARAHDKPVMLAEWGSVEDPAQPGRKAAWIRDALALARSWPQLKAMSYLDAHGTCPWWVDSTPSAAAAFVEIGADPWMHPRPSASLAVATRLGPAPLTARFDGSASTGADAATGAGTSSWTIDFGDGSAPTTGLGRPPADLAHTYAAGTFSARLVVTDQTGRQASDSGPIRAAGPPVTTSGVRNVTGTAVTLRAWVSPQRLAGTARFEWDTTTAYRQQSPVLHVGAISGTAALTFPVTGLVPGSRYNLRVVASTAAGTTIRTSTFDTPGAPTVRYRAPSAVTGSSAVLNGLVHPHSLDSSYHAEWGTTTGYGSRSEPARLATATWERSAPASLAGLRRRTAYHYRIVATNTAGTVRGPDQVVTTR